MHAAGDYAIISTGDTKRTPDKVRDTFLNDPAVILIVVVVVMFFITFCGCSRALRENVHLLKAFSFSLTLVLFTQLAIAVLGLFYSDQVRDALERFVKKSIVYYRDDLDLQNLMDYIQREIAGIVLSQILISQMQDEISSV
ncbi:tetraspanin-33-like [Oncorhynchus kisutch]|uniref:tetraspanin-33-like n=1 Tax=Oncorhynchus kisutch TaxID=8019 RepID=UPI00099F8B65|nr:tetraspanin-33-like [Oncorhynchus kisutch]